MTIPQIQQFITRINNQDITIEGKSLNGLLRLPTKEEWKASVLVNLKSDLQEALSQNSKRIYHRRSRAREDSKYLEEVERGRRKLDFCPNLKSPIGYKPQLCTTGEQANEFIAMGGNKNSSMPQIYKSILEGNPIDLNGNNSEFTFRLVLVIPKKPK